MQQGAFLFFLASRAKERYHDHGATSREGVGMDLSEIVVKTLNDKQLSEALANCLEKLKGHGPAFPEDISGLLRALVHGAATLNTDRPISKASTAWKKDCTTKAQLYLGSENASASISEEWLHLIAARDVQETAENKSLLDELCKRAVTTALLIQAGIEPGKFYN